MLSEPTVVTRPAQPYAAIVLHLTQSEIAQKAPPLIADVIAWLAQRGVRPSGPPFFNYVNFRPGGRMEMQVGIPTDEVIPGEGRVATGTLPGGRFASVTHTGPYDELMQASMALDAWANRQGYALDGAVDGDVFKGTTRMEIYHDPGQGPSGQPVTEVAFRLAQ